MTAEPDLLPRPPLAECSEDSVQEWGRANVAHAIAPLQAEIEALRAEVENLRGDAHRRSNEIAALGDAVQHWKDRAERLAEALREVLIDLERSQANMRNAAKTDPRWEGCADAIQPRVDAARALLREQEAGRG